MSNNIFNGDFLDILALLEKHKIDFLLVGGYAVILYGYIRITGNMDLLIERNIQNYQKLEKVYAEFGSPIFPQEHLEMKILMSGELEENLRNRNYYTG